MKIALDNKLTQTLSENPSEILTSPLISDPNNQISFSWPSLLEYLALGSILKELPAFETSEPIFDACVAALCSNNEKEVIFYLYDTIFTECLNQIKGLPQINAHRLLEAINLCRQKTSYQTIKNKISNSLDHYETALLNHPSHIMHDLVLYLAWNQMCVRMSTLFDYPSEDANYIQNLDTLKECLIESFIHITQQGRTSPSFYRLIESLFFYQIREENMQKHTPEEWTMLSQSFPIISSQDRFTDFWYIDAGLKSNDGLPMKEHKDDFDSYLTLDTSQRVNSRLALTQFILKKIKADTPLWTYDFQPKNVFFV
jgi:hypothetical protein